MPAKKHHYVPVFYQKGFANAHGLLCVYDRKLHTYKELPPRVLCRSENLYTVRNVDGAGDQRIETEILSPIEGAAAPVIRGLRPNMVWTDATFSYLIIFISFQFTRLPSFGRAISCMLETSVNQFMRMNLATPERIERAVDEIERTTRATRIDALAMIEAFTNGRIRIEATERGFLEYMFEQANTLGNWLQECEWTILVAPQATGFILCDHPFVSVPPQGMTLDGMSYGVPGAISYFPLTRRYCLKVREGHFAITFRNLDSRAVRTVNFNIASNSDRFVMASSRPQLESVIDKSACADIEPGERFTVEAVNTTVDKFTIRPRRYFY